MITEEVSQLEKGFAGIADQTERRFLVGVEFGDVDVDELHALGAEHRVRGRGEVGVAGADADDQVGLVGQGVGEDRPRGAERVDHLWVVVGERGLAGLGHPDGNTGLRGERRQLVGGRGVDDATAGDDHRTLGAGDQLGGAPQRAAVGTGPRHVPGALPEQRGREVPGFGLHILREGERDGTGVRRAGQGTHRLQECGRQLVGPVDPVPVLGDSLERIVGRVVPGEARLQLLEHRAGPSAGEDVAGQTQHGQPVHGGGRGTGDHVGCAGTDRAAAGQGTEPVPHLREAGGHVDHPLLVASLVEAKVLAVLQQRLADAGDVAVPEDADGSAEERLDVSVAFDLLGSQEADDRLADGQPLGGLRGLSHRNFLPL